MGTGEKFRFEPTVFGAALRYPVMVLAVALIISAGAAGYTLVVPGTFQARASVTVPEQVSLRNDDGAGSLDAQVLLLQSQDVAARAGSIANSTLGVEMLTARDFSESDGSLEITPPSGADPGTYGASTITVAFTWPNAKIAQVGVN